MKEEWSESDIRANLSLIYRECGTLAKAARRFGVSPQYLHDVLHHRRRVTDRILKRFGLRWITRIVPIPKEEPRG